MADTTIIHGADEIMRKLHKLPNRIGKNAMRRALRKGANVIKKKAVVNAKKIDRLSSKNKIWKNIAVQSASAKYTKWAGGPAMRIGIRGGARSGGSGPGAGGDTFYWRFVEFGTSHSRAEPFMRPAAAESVTEVINVTANDMKIQLDKELAKLL